MTYLDLNGRFGALGHGISDSDTGELVEISDGNGGKIELNEIGLALKGKEVQVQ